MILTKENYQCKYVVSQSSEKQLYSKIGDFKVIITIKGIIYKPVIRACKNILEFPVTLSILKSQLPKNHQLSSMKKNGTKT